MFVRLYGRNSQSTGEIICGNEELRLVIYKRLLIHEVIIIVTTKSNCRNPLTSKNYYYLIVKCKKDIWPQSWMSSKVVVAGTDFALRRSEWPYSLRCVMRVIIRRPKKYMYASMPNSRISHMIPSIERSSDSPGRESYPLPRGMATPGDSTRIRVRIIIFIVWSAG